MKKLSVLMIAIIALSISISITFAQAGPDRDGDGVDDSVDSCISDIGPASNNGCPVPADATTTTTDTTTTDTTTTNNPDDRDGDGTNDVSDNCPDSGGPSSNAGCPIDDTTTQPEPTAAPTVLPTNPLRPVVGGDCQLATRLITRVNVRQSFTLQAPVVDVITPDMLYEVLGVIFIEDYAWYLIDKGWVSDISVVLGGDCGSMSRVSYIPELISVDLSQSDDPLRAYCYDVLGQEICFGTGPIVLSDGNLGGDSTNTTNLPLMCREWNNRVDCFIAEGIAGALIDWSQTEEDDAMTPFSLDLIVDALSTDDSDGLVFDPFRPTIFVPDSTTSTRLGDPTTNDGTTYPYCDALLNQFIMSQIPADGSNPIRNELIEGYLMVSVELMNPDALPEPEPCVKLVVLPEDRSQMTANNFLPGYVVQYDSWPPNGFPISTNSTVPIFAMPIDADSAANGGMTIDILGGSTPGNTEKPSLWDWINDQYWGVALDTIRDTCPSSINGGTCCPCDA